MKIQKISEDQIEVLRFGIKESALGEIPIVETTCWRRAKEQDPRGIEIDGVGGKWIFLHATNAMFDITGVYPTSRTIDKPAGTGVISAEATSAFDAPSGPMNVLQIPLPSTIREVESEADMKNSLNDSGDRLFEIV